MLLAAELFCTDGKPCLTQARTPTSPFLPCPQLSACEGVLPRISSIRPLVLHAGNLTTSSSDTANAADPAAAGGPGTDAAGSDPPCQQRPGGELVMVRGSALLGEQCRLLVRSGGSYPLVEILASSGPLGAPRRAAVTAGTAGTAGVSSVFAQDEEWLEIRWVMGLRLLRCQPGFGLETVMAPMTRWLVRCASPQCHIALLFDTTGLTRHPAPCPSLAGCPRCARASTQLRRRCGGSSVCVGCGWGVKVRVEGGTGNPADRLP